MQRTRLGVFPGVLFSLLNSLARTDDVRYVAGAGLSYHLIPCFFSDIIVLIGKLG